MADMKDDTQANVEEAAAPAAESTAGTNEPDAVIEPAIAEAEADIAPKAKKAAGKKSNRKGPRAAPESEQRHKKTSQEKTEAEPAGPNMRCLELPALVPIPLPAGLLSKPVELAFSGVRSSAASLSAALVVCSAAASHAYDLEAIKKDRPRVPLVLRLAIVGKDRERPAAIGAVLDGAFDAQAREMKAGEEAEAVHELKRVLDRTRRRLLLSTMANAALLGLPDVATDITVAPEIVPQARAQFVVRDVRPTAVQKAVNGSRKGLIVVDDRKMPNLPRIGINYDEATGGLLNRSARGLPLEIDDGCGLIRMRKSPISVIGVHTPADILSLDKSSFYELSATAFLPDDLAETTCDPKAICEFAKLVARLRDLPTTGGGEAHQLKLNAAAKKMIESVGRKAQSEGSLCLGALLDFSLGVGDLIHRFAGILHVVEHVVVGKEPSPEIGQETMKRAVDFVEKVIVPAAKLVLYGASMHPDERNARRILSYAQRHTSPQWPHLLRRDLVRSFQRTMRVNDIDDALAVLVKDGLLMKADENGGAPGLSFTVHEEVFVPHRRLPDLVGDPRRTS